MKKPLLTTSLAAAAVVLSAACIMVMDPEQTTSWQPRGEFRRTVEFAAGGTLTLENKAGNVEITGWDKDAVEVVAQGAAAETGEKRKVRAYGFWEIKPDVEIKQTDGSLSIRTRPFDGPGDLPAVDYTIRVPNSILLSGIRMGKGNLTVSDVFGRIEVSLDRGDLAVSNFSGSVDLFIGTGSADVEVLDVRDQDTIAISSREGDIVLRLGAGTGARVEAEAPRGEVRSDLDLGARTPAPSVSGRIGTGEAAVTLKASDGRIEIIAIKDVAGAVPVTKGK
ncbi:MAG: hypothetical protein A2Y70_07220 [Candidatus Aminicenantes bacterium RBG_13_64_14]|nr:MAG: hypothetical protein A2Y70_07220 [Candidatus Aminicenantes bacterium RBG_13_64_14]